MALFYIFVYTFLPVFHSLWFWTPDFHWGSSTSTPLPLLLCLMAGWRSLSVYETVPSPVWGTVTTTFSAGETSLALPVVSLALLSIWNLWQWHTTHFFSGTSFTSSRWIWTRCYKLPAIVLITARWFSNFTPPTPAFMFQGLQSLQSFVPVFPFSSRDIAESKICIFAFQKLYLDGTP